MTDRKKAMNRAWRQHDQRGTSTLEFIVVLPVLLFIFFGIMELSRAWLTLNIVTTAARDGARVGAVTPTAAGDVFVPASAEARIDQILAAANLSTGATRSVTCTTPCVPDSQVVTNVSVTFQTVMPVFLPMLQSLNIQQSALMRYE